MNSYQFPKIILNIIVPFLSFTCFAQSSAPHTLQHWLVEAMAGDHDSGDDRYYLLMPGGTVDSFSAGHQPAAYPGIDGVTALAGGGRHVLALKKDGTVWSWGSNSDRQLGNKDLIKQSKATYVPVQVSGMSHAVAVSAVYNTSYALLADGTVWAWGKGNLGQTGQKVTGAYSNFVQPLPVQVPGITNAIAISGAMALLKDGTIVTWGDGSRGQLGNGTNKATATPVAVTGIKNAVAIGSGEDFNLALLADGTVWGWGYNAKGQLGREKMGLDANSFSNLPIQIKGLDHIVAISAGATCLALTKDGTVMAWGWGAIGGMGSGKPGTSDENPVPKKVPLSSNIIGIYSNKSTGLALMADGTLWGWGANVVATGVYHQSWKPVIVTKLGGRYF
ncbi:MAG: RCC1 domain-containing protein [Flavisolibacter sp.]